MHVSKSVLLHGKRTKGWNARCASDESSQILDNITHSHAKGFGDFCEGTNGDIQTRPLDQTNKVVMKVCLLR